MKLSFFKVFKIIAAITTGLSAAIEDNQITIGEISDILGSVCMILDIPITFKVPDDLKTQVAGIKEI